MIKKNILFLGIALTFFLGCFNAYAKTVVVFVHGTVLPGLSLLDMADTYKDRLKDDSRYVAATKRIRNDTRFWEDQAVLGEGLWPIMTIANQEQQTLCQAAAGEAAAGERADRFAVYPLTRAFDAMAHWAGYLEGDVSYYAFGHLGLLSQTYRKEQGYALYKELICLMRQAKEPIRIIICAHSHGGNIALYLAEAEEQFHEGLFIDDLLLFGTPVQLETACCAFKKPFKRVVSFFSASDAVQLSDWLSTKSAASFRTFTMPHKQGSCRYAPPQKSYGQVVDMRCQVNGDTCSLTHQNFWYLGRSRRLCASIDMLPFMVFAPVYVTLLRRHATSYTMLVDAHLDQKRSSALSCVLVFQDKVQQGLSENEAQQLDKLVHYYDHDAQLSWKPTYKHRVLLLYREDFMREMLGLFSWIDFKVRLWGYKTFKAVRQWF